MAMPTTRTHKTIWKKNKTEELTYLDLKSYYKAGVIQIVRYWYKHGYNISGIEFSNKLVYLWASDF